MVVSEPSDLDRAIALVLEAHLVGIEALQSNDRHAYRTARAVGLRAAWRAAHALSLREERPS